MNNLMMNLSTGNEFAIRAGYGHYKRAVYLGNIRPVGVRLRPDGTLGWRDDFEVTFDPKVFSFAVKTSNGRWERRCYTQNSCEEALVSSWSDYKIKQQEERKKKERIDSLCEQLFNLARELFGDEVEKNYSSGIRVRKFRPEDIPVAMKLKNLETLSIFQNLHDFDFHGEEQGEAYVEAFQRELDKRNQSEVA